MGAMETIAPPQITERCTKNVQFQSCFSSVCQRNTSININETANGILLVEPDESRMVYRLSVINQTFVYDCLPIVYDWC